MNLGAEEIELLEQMSKQLDASMIELTQREIKLVEEMGQERASVLRQYWEHRLTPSEELELSASMDWRERELIWIWARQRQTADARAAAGKSLMRYVL